METSWFMIDYAKNKIKLFILDQLSRNALDENQIGLEMIKYDLNSSLLTTWYLEMERDGLIYIPNLVKEKKEIWGKGPHVCGIESGEGTVKFRFRDRVVELKHPIKAEEYIANGIPNVLTGGFTYLPKTFSITESGRVFLENGGDEKSRLN